MKGTRWRLSEPIGTYFDLIRFWKRRKVRKRNENMPKGYMESFQRAKVGRREKNIERNFTNSPCTAHWGRSVPSLALGVSATQGLRPRIPAISTKAALTADKSQKWRGGKGWRSLRDFAFHAVVCVSMYSSQISNGIFLQKGPKANWSTKMLSLFGSFRSSDSQHSLGSLEICTQQALR